ncbi:hypothetical protein ANCDUO_13144 [Ancylostoma duodenale]|uniref:7TM GPCR serpentine receptor class x (Srx) domain-containing protein n=1 Tax=Ancylostoma duodenale TaxID=51022 RepID=A0A0C2D3P1_9BILA|nr:hypothetical protein ANCDUO_13144 [Ancylostoma duodenale]
MTGQESLSYVNVYHAVNNVIVAITTTFLYFYLCIKLYFKTRSAASKVGRFQKQVCLRDFTRIAVNH